MKGEPDEVDLKVSYVRNDKDPKSMDFGKWLHQHVSQRHGIDLLKTDIKDLSEDLQNKFIWDLIGVRFTSAAFYAGCPRLMFSFHSFRSGYLSAAILNAEFEGGSLNTALLNKQL